MGSALWKDTLREIKKTPGRFFSIMMIVAIGVAFFAGVKASIPDMKHTADQYFDDYHLMDLRVVSTFGLTKDDVSEIQKIDGIEGIFATHTIDVLTLVNSEQYVVKIHALPQNTDEQNMNYLNRVELVEGRLPQKSGECVIQETSMFELPIQVGDQLDLESGKKEALSESLKTNAYTVVGKVKTPYYLSGEIGSSDIGNGKIDFFMMIPQNEFKAEIYTEINLTVSGARDFNSYDDAYFEHVDRVKRAIENIAQDRSEVRFEEIKSEAQKQLDQRKQEYDNGKQTFEKEMKTQENKLDMAKTEMILGRASLSVNKDRYADQFASYRIQIEEGKQQLEALKATYERSEKTYEETKPQLMEQLDQLETQIADITKQIAENEEAIKECEQQLKNPELTELERRLLEEKLSSLRQSKQIAETALPYLEPAKQALEYQMKQGEAGLKQTAKMIETQEQQLTIKEQELKDGEAKAQEEFTLGEAKLKNAETAYNEGKVALEKARISGQADLDKGKEQLEKAQKDLEEMAEPQWYVLDRHAHYSYMDYGSVADRMEGIAKVFPLFFFLVAALVCLTTMTRMVDEQRGNIGTMKALGYGKNAIASKFILYALIASVFGSLLGCCLGMTIFPTVIFNAWNLMYTLPSISFISQSGLAISASLIVTMITVSATVAAVYKELTETPALLMRPKAPKAGKKIIMERITFLWKRMSFIQKVTARNLFRYKKRFLMTVIGISGCTALLVAGFGIQDSISSIVDKQYGEILKYDVSLQLQENVKDSEQKELLKQLQTDSRISAVTGITSESAIVYANDEEQTVTIVTADDTEALPQFISLHSRGSSEELPLGSDGVLISEKLSMNCKVKSGDMLEIDAGDGIKRKVTISGIVENYVGHYLYMSPSLYKEVFHIRPYDNTFVIKLNQLGSNEEQALGNDLMKQESVLSVSFYSGIASSFSDTIASLSFVVVVLVIAAGLLAFIVLYNLTNVNISERLREIATIKVLGFYDLEVAQYVYRENILLTMIGSLCGLGLGIGLHRLIMNLAEMENVMFGRTIEPLSFLISFCITMLFGMIVNIVMYRKLKKIPMVESLKSVE